MSGPIRSLVFTLVLCVTCSLLLTAAATGLRDRQQANMLADRQKNLLQSVGLVTPEEMQEIVEMKPEKLHLVITGRGASQWLIDRADMVTEMKEVKHPYQKGILAQKGVDY